jgi:Putative Actinobacterial Holin-X, holin superfamily III
LPAENGQPDNIATAITEVSENLTKLVQDELELAKAEMVAKAASLARGAAAVAAGAVFGVFAVIFVLLTIAWALDAVFVSGVGSIWLGFGIVMAILLVLTVGAFLFAWKKLKVGPPTPKMAIDEAKKIRETMSSPSTSASLPSTSTSRTD